MANSSGFMSNKDTVKAITMSHKTTASIIFTEPLRAIPLPVLLLSYTNGLTVNERLDFSKLVSGRVFLWDF